MEIKKSTLYIIPSFISNDSLEHISKYNLRIIDEINHFIVESEKKSRRFIKKFYQKIKRWFNFLSNKK